MKAIGEGRLSPEDLKSDRKNCIHYEETGLGKKALFLPFLGIGRRAYIPLSSIDRVYKRLYVSKGFFEEGKIYKAEIRSTSRGEDCRAFRTPDGFSLEFISPVKAATPGQSAVVYDGDRVICSGVIERAE